MKLQNFDQIKEKVNIYRREGKKIVWTNGCFDLLHPGHIYSLRKAKNSGDILIVGIDSDRSIRRLKGPSRPIINEKQRIESLEELECIDHIILFNYGEVKKIIEALKPDVYVKSGNYTLETINQEERKIIENYGGEIYLPEGLPDISTTGIINKLQKKKLLGKVALITGATSGIGKAIAIEFAKEGASIITTYKNKIDVANELEQDLSKYHIHLEKIKCDLESIEDIKKLAKTISNRLNKIDILVNNAALYNRNDINALTEYEWDKTFNINLRAPFFLIKHLSRFMNKNGSIINISSNVSLKSKKDWGIDYATSKAGLDYITKSFALNLAPEIRVNSINPGFTDTRMFKFHKNPEKISEVKLEIPLKRINHPEDIAKTALFLASEDSRNITGQNIVVDGGKNIQ